VVYDHPKRAEERVAGRQHREEGVEIEGGGAFVFRMDSELSGRSQHRLLLYDRLIGLG
jgi:hypothetical protein